MLFIIIRYFYTLITINNLKNETINTNINSQIYKIKETDIKLCLHMSF